MPKVKIVETDVTGVENSGEQPNIVYIPGAIASGVKSAPKLYQGLSAFLSDKSLYIEDLSYLLAKRLLKLGMQVVYQGFPLSAQTSSISSNQFTIGDVLYTISGTTVTWGDDNSATIDELQTVELNGVRVKIDVTESIVTYPVAINVASTSINAETKKFIIEGIEYTLNDNYITWTDSSSVLNRADVVNGVVSANSVVMYFDYINNIVNYKSVYVSDGSITISDDDWKLLEDKDLYNVRFLTTGGYACPTLGMLECAANREGDCTALVDHPNYDDYNVATVRAFFEGFEAINSISGLKHSDPLSCATGFSPWVKLSITDNSDAISVCPASFDYLLAYARMIQLTPLWEACAGVKRGEVPELVDVCYKLSKAEAEILQARGASAEVEMGDELDNVGMAINPISYKRFSGFAGGFNYVVNGNRTMHVNAGKLIATSFLNVRLLISEICKTLYDASIAHTFDQNNEVLWSNFRAMVTPLLDKMQSSGGIEGYRLDRVASGVKGRLSAKLTIVPIEGVEDFSLEIVLADSIEVIE